MALRHWRSSRILGLWTGWLAGLLLLLLAAVIVTPTGVSLQIAPAGLPLWKRFALGAVALVAACLPPAMITYVWYTARLKAWSKDTPRRIDRTVAREMFTDAERAQQLLDAAQQDPVRRPHDRVSVRPPIDSPR
jgi:hypothetical protein